MPLTTVRSSSDTYDPMERLDFQNELIKLIYEIDEIANHTEFNGKLLLTGQFIDDLAFSFRITDNRFKLNIGDMSAYGLELVVKEDDLTLDERIYYKILGADGTLILDITSVEKASLAISVIDKAILRVGSERTNLGSSQNKIECTITHLAISLDFNKQQILDNSITTMMAHTQIQPITVMTLIVG